MARVFLWSCHRCASTAVERSIRELDKVKVIHEPNCFAFFCEDGSLRKDETVFEDKRKYILSHSELSDGYEHIFIKDLAYYVRGSFEQYTEGAFTTFKHTFLIRDPMAVASSMQRMSKAEGRVPFFTDTLGFEELYNMYEIVKTNKPTIISAEDLFDHPR